MRIVGVLLLLPIVAVAVEPPVTAISFAPDGKSVVVGSQAGVKLFTWPDLRLDRTISTELSNVHDVAFSPDGKMLAVAGGSPAEKGTIELWSWPDIKLLHRLSPHKDVIHAIAWSADSRSLATASADQTAKVLDLDSGKVKATLEGHSRGVRNVVFLPGDKQVVTAGTDETLRVWDCATGKLERNLSHHTKAVTGLAVRPSRDKTEPVVASIADDRTVRIWQPTLGRMVRFARVDSEPRAIAWTADGSSIVIACKDGSVRVIDPETVEVVATIPVIDGIVHCLAIAPNGEALVGGRDGQLKRTQISSSKR
jgi:WD40 repeat protein